MSSDFDTAGRYLAKMDAAPFVGWAARLPPAAFRYRGWVDARRVRFPGEGDRTCDTVAWLEELATGAPWAWPIEFQLKPDFDMFGRMLVYLGTLWLEQHPHDLPGDRFALGATVINLTGVGHGSRVMACEANGARLELALVERNLAEESAAEALAGIVAGTVPEVVLGLIPLMKGGGELGIIEAWVRRAGAIMDDRRRRRLGDLALVFSEAAERRDVWGQALEGWDMIRSKVADEWRAEGRADSLIELLRERFGPLPAEFVRAIEAVKDLDRHRAFFGQALRCSSLDQFRQLSGL